MNIPNPVIQQIGSTKNYKLIIGYKSRIYKNTFLTISKGFIYDGASIPSLLWFLLGSPFEYSFAIIHDALFKAHMLGFFKSNWIFLKVCKFKKVSFIRRWLIWIGLTLFGWITWILKSKHSIQTNRKKVLVEVIV